MNKSRTYSVLTGQSVIDYSALATRLTSSCDDLDHMIEVMNVVACLSRGQKGVGVQSPTRRPKPINPLRAARLRKDEAVDITDCFRGQERGTFQVIRYRTKDYVRFVGRDAVSAINTLAQILYNAFDTDFLPSYQMDRSLSDNLSQEANKSARFSGELLSPWYSYEGKRETLSALIKHLTAQRGAQSITRNTRKSINGTGI